MEATLLSILVVYLWIYATSVITLILFTCVKSPNLSHNDIAKGILLAFLPIINTLFFIVVIYRSFLTVLKTLSNSDED